MSKFWIEITCTECQASDEDIDIQSIKIFGRKKLCLKCTNCGEYTMIDWHKEEIK